MSKKRAFVRYTKKGKLVPGSLITTQGSHPSGPAIWKEVAYDLCCDGGGCPQRVYDPFVTFEAQENLFTGEFNLVQMIWQCDGFLPEFDFTAGSFRILDNPVAPSNFSFSNWDDVINFLNTNFSAVGAFSYLGGVNVQVVTTPSINEYIQCPNAQFFLEFATP